ncbi:MAG TPA: hypothetical protein VL361_19505 [Candidatus Limnocylindrales bacterium]|jgi:hypothetical protein|nr:hypothetical protein [Candidatus Limnocylindrales bacterium]
MDEPSNPVRSERTFDNIVAGSTAVAFGLVFCSLACVANDLNGVLTFQWRWTALIWLAVGLGGGWFFWHMAWGAERAATRRAKNRFVAYCVLLSLVTLYLFVRPLKFVAKENVRDVLVGLGLAIAVLTLFGWMIHTLVQWLSREE